MAKRIKVFQGDCRARGSVQASCFIGATSKKQLSEIIGESTRDISKYWSETSNSHCVEVGQAFPGVLFAASDLTGLDYLPYDRSINLAKPFSSLDCKKLSNKAKLLGVIADIKSVIIEHRIIQHNKAEMMRFAVSILGLGSNDYCDLTRSTGSKPISDDLAKHINTLLAFSKAEAAFVEFIKAEYDNFK